jgi:hypothetical protein
MRAMQAVWSSGWEAGSTSIWQRGEDVEWSEEDLVE